MYEDIKSADAVIFGSPIYFYQVTGQAKIWMDRMYPCIDLPEKPGDSFPARYPGKKIVTVYTQGNPDKNAFKSSIDFTDGVFKVFGWDVVDTIVCAGTGAPDYRVPEDLLKKAFEDGKLIVL